jgi:hypothetical protein
VIIREGVLRKSLSDEDEPWEVVVVEGGDA